MKARITVNKNFRVGEIDRRIYGSFIEHIGRAVYSGIYEPGHESADELGFRTDVMELVREIGVPIVRYPGGNFVSGYDWRDGTGERSARPRKPDLAWRTIETNEIGIDEFQEWAKRAGTEIMMAVNLGTGTAADAGNLVEYCNLSTDTYYANMRKKNGFDKPFGIKTWCLGNEMDGPWQTGHKTAEEYGRIAAEAGKIMKWTDPSIEIVACGSSNYDMPTFGDWELTVLDHAYEQVDYVSLHQYYGNQKNDAADFLARSEHLDAFIKSVAALCDAVKAKKHSKKTINLSLDEWNVWYHSNSFSVEDWQIAPPILEDIYNFEDALLIGCMLITMQNNCDRVKMACLAQLVNVIAPIMTERGGAAWRQTIFYPYALASAHGNGATLKSIIECDSYLSSDKLVTPYVCASVIEDAAARKITVFAVNRSLDLDIDLEIDLQGYEGARLVRHTELYADDLKCENTKEAENVRPEEREISGATVLKKHSWNMLVFEY